MKIFIRSDMAKTLSVMHVHGSDNFIGKWAWHASGIRSQLQRHRETFHNSRSQQYDLIDNLTVHKDKYAWGSEISSGESFLSQHLISYWRVRSVLALVPQLASVGACGEGYRSDSMEMKTAGQSEARSSFF